MHGPTKSCLHLPPAQVWQSEKLKDFIGKCPGCVLSKCIQFGHSLSSDVGTASVPAVLGFTQPGLSSGVVVDLSHLWGHGRKWNKFPLSFYHFLLIGKERLLSFTCCFSSQQKLVLRQMIANVCCGEGIPRCGCGGTDLPLPASCPGMVLPGPAQTAVAGMCQLLVSVPAGWQGC